MLLKPEPIPIFALIPLSALCYLLNNDRLVVSVASGGTPTAIRDRDGTVSKHLGSFDERLADIVSRLALLERQFVTLSLLAAGDDDSNVDSGSNLKQVSSTNEWRRIIGICQQRRQQQSYELSKTSLYITTTSHRAGTTRGATCGAAPEIVIAILSSAGSCCLVKSWLRDN